jgi:FkbM family methyltransferase
LYHGESGSELLFALIRWVKARLPGLTMKGRFLYRAFKTRYRDQQAEIRALVSALSAGDTAVDVGANKGAYLYWMRRRVGKSGKVVAFEPQVRLAAYLRAMVSRMGWTNVSIREAALSDAPGDRVLHVPGTGDSPGASLEDAVLTTGACRDETCTADTLDRQLEGERVALIKVDVEGHELAVFRGAERTLAESRPTLLFECEARHLTRHTPRDVFAFLEKRGYQGSFFTPDGLTPVAQFDEALHQRRVPGRFWKEPGYRNNFLFRPASLNPSTGATRGRPSGPPGTLS